MLIHRIFLIHVRLSCLLLCLALPNLGNPMETPSFTVVDHTIQVRCVSANQRSIVILQWTSGSEIHVSTYRVHRISLTEPAQHRWVNQFPLTATGPRSNYRIIDSQVMPGVAYHYRVYGFEESGRLSLATWVTLEEQMLPSCRYFPLIKMNKSV